VAATVSRAGAEGIDLPLTDAAGDTLVVPDVDVAVTCNEGVMNRLALEIRVPFEIYQRIADTGTFHLQPEHRGKSFHPLQPGSEVELELELASALVARLSGDAGIDHAAGAIGLLMRLAEEASPDEPLLRASSWYAMHVKQGGGALKAGYSTSWSQAGKLG
jgi:hypothetical protein